MIEQEAATVLVLGTTSQLWVRWVRVMIPRVLVMVVGTAMDMTPTILILTPVLMPVVNAAGIDPVYFGVMFIINNSIGLVTPPVGTVLNVVAGVGRMSMDDVTRGVLPFMLAEFAVMFLMVLFPWLVIWPARLFAGCRGFFFVDGGPPVRGKVFIQAHVIDNGEPGVNDRACIAWGLNKSPGMTKPGLFVFDCGRTNVGL